MQGTDAREAPVVGTGTLAFLFTDIAGSTRLWEDLPAAMADALARHDVILSYHATNLAQDGDRAARGFVNHLSFYDLTLLFDRYGFRVPGIVISPYARRGAVVHTRYDQFSFLRTAELMGQGKEPRKEGAIPLDVIQRYLN